MILKNIVDTTKTRISIFFLVCHIVTNINITLCINVIQTLLSKGMSRALILSCAQNANIQFQCKHLYEPKI